MPRRRLACSLTALLLVACGGGSGAHDAGASSDAGATMDAGGGGADAGVDAGPEGDAGGDAAAGSDAGPAPDAGPFDAAMPDAGFDAGTDAGPFDAGLPDAGTPPDAGSSCAGLGQECNETTMTCPSGLQCLALDSAGIGVCFPTTPICGGFAGASCPAGLPVCLAYPGASGWPCATDSQRDCMCATAAGRARLDPTVCAP